MTNKTLKTKAIAKRDLMGIQAQYLLDRAVGPLTTDQIAEALGTTPKATNLILLGLEKDQRATKLGISRNYGGLGVRWTRYTPPVAAYVPEFRPLKPLRQTVIPIRENGRMAPDISDEATVSLLSKATYYERELGY